MVQMMVATHAQTLVHRLLNLMPSALMRATLQCLLALFLGSSVRAPSTAKRSPRRLQTTNVIVTNLASTSRSMLSSLLILLVITCAQAPLFVPHSLRSDRKSAQSVGLAEPVADRFRLSGDHGRPSVDCGQPSVGRVLDH